MSVDATRWAWSVNVQKSTERLVLLSLADRANEDNECFPSMQRITNDTMLDIKTVKKVISDLIQKGLILDTGERKGFTQKVRVLRLVGVDCREDKQTQKRNDSKNGMNPNFPTNEPKIGTNNEPKNGTLNEPKIGTQNLPRNLPKNLSGNLPVSAEAQKTKNCGLQDLILLGVEKQYAEDWLKVRKVKKAALTQSAINLLSKEAEKANISVNDAVRVCAENAWQGFKAEWFFKLNNNQSKPQTTTFSRHNGFAQRDYSVGINEDGSF